MGRWAGTALFTALALGAQLGSAIYAWMGFGAVGPFATLTPAAVLWAVLRLPATVTEAGQPMMFGTVLKSVYMLGICMALAGFGYGAMVSFSVLLFVERNWAPSWAGLPLFSFALIVARVTIGSLPDRIGGARSAALSLMVQVAGFGLMALSQDRTVGLLGAWVAGFGYAIVYPALGREAVRRFPNENRGTAVAVYSAFIDLTLGLGSPLLGLLAGAVGTGSVFIFAGAMALLAVLVLAKVHRNPAP